MTTDTTRRALVAGLAAAPVAALPALAGAAPQSDPIFAALAERERLEALHLAAIDEEAALQFGDDREAYRAASERTGIACGAVCDQERETFAMQPQTVAGALALLRFVADMLDVYLPAERFGEPDAIRACADFFEREAGR